MCLLRTSLGAGQGSERCGVRERGAQLKERRVRGSGLFVFAPSGQGTLGAIVQSLQRPPTGLKRPESTLRLTPGSVSLSGCPSTRSHLCPGASLTNSGSGPSSGSTSLPVRLPNRKSERATQALTAHAQGQTQRLLSCGKPAAASEWA